MAEDKYKDFACLRCGSYLNLKRDKEGKPFCPKHYGKYAGEKRGRYSGKSKFWDYRDKEFFSEVGYAK